MSVTIFFNSVYYYHIIQKPSVKIKNSIVFRFINDNTRIWRTFYARIAAVRLNRLKISVFTFFSLQFCLVFITSQKTHKSNGPFSCWHVLKWQSSANKMFPDGLMVVYLFCVCLYKKYVKHRFIIYYVPFLNMPSLFSTTKWIIDDLFKYIY